MLKSVLQKNSKLKTKKIYRVKQLKCKAVKHIKLA